jgi:hypothetical protein
MYCMYMYVLMQKILTLLCIAVVENTLLKTPEAAS